MKSGYEIGGRHSQDPIGSEGKSLSQRKHRNDGPSWTPSERYERNKLMKQFCHLEGVNGNTQAYREASCWCDCGRHLKADGRDSCLSCLDVSTGDTAP